MGTPTVSTFVATNNTNIDVTFSEAVTMNDLTGITVTVNSENVSITQSAVSSTVISFGIPSVSSSDTIVMSIAGTNTIESVSTSDGLAADLDNAVTNSVTVAPTEGAQQDAASVHTAVAVLAKATKVACKAAC